MTAAGPWSVKGIDPKAREIAKDLARRSGLTLGDWLNQMIIEGGGDPEPAAPTSVEAPAPAVAAPARRVLDELYREAQAARRGPADGGRMARALESLASRVEAGEQRSTLALSGMDQSMLGVLTRLDDLDREHMATGARLSGLLGEVRSAQTAIAERLRRSSEDGVSVAALQALQDGLSRLAARMDAAAERAEAGEGEAKATSADLSRRLDRVETVVEAAPAAFADAEKVETVLTRMAERLDHNDTKTDAAMQSLQSSFANLDARLRSGEARLAHVGGQDLERRFQGLANELTQRVEATRAELAQRLRSVADGRLDRLEAGLKDLGGQVELAEKRSAQTIDRIGREVMRVAHSLGGRVEAVEHASADHAGRTDARVADLEASVERRVVEMEARSASAAEAMAGEMSRAADAMEARLRDADGAQAQALEKLGGEIERIAERLAERISAADRRQAEAIDEVADKVSRIGASFDQRHDQVSDEIGERIRASETRTAELLEEARNRLSRRAAETRPEPPIEAAVPPGPPPMDETPSPPRAFAPAEAETAFETLIAPLPTAGAAAAHAIEDHDASPASNADPFDFPTPEPTPAAAPSLSEPGWSADADPFAARGAGDFASPFNPDDDFAPAASADVAERVFAPVAFETQGLTAPHPSFATTSGEAEDEPFEPAFTGFSVSDFAPAAAAAEALPIEPRPEQLSTRQMLEAARQAARRAAAGKGGETALADGSVPALPREPKAQAPRPFGITFPGRRKKETAPTLRTFVLASGIAGSLTAMSVGAYLMGGTSHGGAPLAGEVAAGQPAPDAGAALAPSAAPDVAVAMTPALPTKADADAAKATDDPPARTRAETSAKASAPAKADAAPIKTTPAQLYAAAAARLESGDLTALPDLRAAAEKGVPAAQVYLARLYDQGGAGVAKDPTEARHWTQLAAEGGDPSAMYNLASYLYTGDGGPKQPAKAADWFRKSAEHGVVNGQYNLAQLYEKGYGVPQSDAEAYKWYLVAAGSGDSQSRLAAQALKAKLSTDAQLAAQKSAAQVRAGLDTAVKTAAATPPTQP